jgi:hypothetical protein
MAPVGRQFMTRMSDYVVRRRLLPKKERRQAGQLLQMVSRAVNIPGSYKA